MSSASVAPRFVAELMTRSYLGKTTGAKNSAALRKFTQSLALLWEDLFACQRDTGKAYKLPYQTVG